MTAHFNLHLAWVALLFVTGCRCTPPSPSAHPEDLAAIQEAASAYAAGFQSGRVDEWLAAVTQDFVAISPGKPALTGTALRREVERDLTSMEIKSLRFELLETEVFGETAWARGQSTADLLMGGDRIRLRGSFLWILRKIQGTWLIARDAATDDGPFPN